jgi:hypothetical protein
MTKKHVDTGAWLSKPAIVMLGQRLRRESPVREAPIPEAMMELLTKLDRDGDRTGTG